MPKPKKFYKCKECGHQSAKWYGKCPECGNWNTFEEKVEQVNKAGIVFAGNTEAQKLIDVSIQSSERILTGDAEFDRVVGGGLVRDSVNIITAPPGMGKSTLNLGLANKLAKRGIKVLYASGEESESQLKDRANRILGRDLSDKVYVLSDPQKKMDNVLASIEAIDPKVIIVDSIQTFTLDAYLPSRVGSPTQVIECGNAIVSVCKNKKNPRCAIIVGQQVKNETLAGPMALEHLVDAVFYLEGEPQDELRILYSSKNRYGGTEVGLYSMQEDGMIPIKNPSEYFITKRAEGEYVPGSTITIIREGTRPLAIEIESLISKSFAPYPSRLSEGLKKDQLNILISILEQRGGINLWEKNVVVKSTGNLQLRESSVGLAVAMSIASSVYKTAIPSDTVFIGELGLTGELKKVQSIEQRVREADRMGFTRIIVPDQVIKYTPNSIKIIKMKTLLQVIKYIFNVE